jgi:hypothetical protein
MRCLIAHPSGNRTPHARSEGTTTGPPKAEGTDISQMQQERPNWYRGAAQVNIVTEASEQRRLAICMMMTSYNKMLRNFSYI